MYFDTVLKYALTNDAMSLNFVLWLNHTRWLLWKKDANEEVSKYNSLEIHFRILNTQYPICRVRTEGDIQNKNTQSLQKSAWETCDKIQLTEGDLEYFLFNILYRT